MWGVELFEEGAASTGDDVPFVTSAGPNHEPIGD
jgi:hypothetical protein